MAVIFDLRLVAYAPDGKRLGILPHPLNSSSGFALNAIPALTMSYTRGMPGSEWLEDSVEIAVEYNTGAERIEPPNGRALPPAWSGAPPQPTRPPEPSPPGSRP